MRDAPFEKDCHACEQAEKNPLSGAYSSNCSCCKARALANGRELFDGMQKGTKTPEYQQALARVFGEGNEEAGHTRVKQWVRRIKDHQKGTV